MKHLALIRGINVGGNNLIKMADLKKLFISIGFENAGTYIQSGNVLFSSSESVKNIKKKIEKALTEKLSNPIKVLILSEKQLNKIITDAPTSFGTKPDAFRYDVVYLFEPLTAKEAFKVVEIKEGIEKAHQGKSALYFSRIKAESTKGRLSKIVSKPEYQLMTLRNWNTTTKLQKKLTEL